MIRLRRFAIPVLMHFQNPRQSIAEMMGSMTVPTPRLRLSPHDPELRAPGGVISQKREPILPFRLDRPPKRRDIAVEAVGFPTLER